MRTRKPKGYWTDEKLVEAASKFKTRWAFQRGNPSAYSAAQKRGLLDKVCSRMEAQHTDWTDEKLVEAAAEFKTRAAFYRGNRKAYQAAQKRGLLDKVCSRMEAQHTDWTDEMLVEAASKFTTRWAFQRGNNRAYQAAKKRGLLDEVCGHMEARFRWTPETLAEEAQKYTTRWAFQRGNLGAYLAARTRGLLDEVCGHMEDGSPSDNDTIYIWKALNVFFMGHQVYKVGITSARLGMQRVNEGARAGGMEYELLRLINVNGKATALEELILKLLGRDPQFTGFDGCTEYRAMTPKELAEAVDLIDSEEI